MNKLKTMCVTLLLLMPTMALADITVEDAWVRLPPPVADTAAGYMIIKNSGDQDVEITDIETSAAKTPEFHSMSMHDGMMHMGQMDKVIVPAHGEITFSSGGNHLMLIGLTDELKAGGIVMMTIKTAAGESVMVHAEVRDLRSNSDHHKSGGMDHGGHHHH